MADTCISGEMDVIAGYRDDADVCVQMKKGVWFCLPHPMIWASGTEYYGDHDEAGHALFDAYKVLHDL